MHLWLPGDFNVSGMQSTVQNHPGGAASSSFLAPSPPHVSACLSSILSALSCPPHHPSLFKQLPAKSLSSFQRPRHQTWEGTIPDSFPWSPVHWPVIHVYPRRLCSQTHLLASALPSAVILGELLHPSLHLCPHPWSGHDGYPGAWPLRAPNGRAV